MSGGACVSIVVNNFNYGWCLRDAVGSALAQTHPATQVIVVDDGSTDQSRQILQEYADRVELVLKSNGGQASALNAGFARSRGEFVIFLDADDVLDPEAAARAVAAWRPGVSKVQWRLRIVDGDRVPLGYCHPPTSQPAVQGDVLDSLLARGRYVTSMTSGNMFPRQVLQQIMPMPEGEYAIAADGYLVSLAPFHGEIITLDAPLGEYRRHGSNLWSVESLDAARLRSFVRHNEDRHAVIARTAEARGLRTSASPGDRDLLHLRSRLICRRLSGSEPARSPRDRAQSTPALAVQAVRVALGEQDLAPWRRAATALWFAVVGFGPVRVVPRLAEWAYVPHRRPDLQGRWLRRRAALRYPSRTRPRSRPARR